MATFKDTVIDASDDLTIPQGTTAQRPGQPGQPAAEAGMVRFNTDLNETEYYDGSDWHNLENTGVEATGGTIYDIEQGGVTYRAHVFTTVGSSTLNVTTGGEVEAIIVGGGGGGGFGHGGGGGGGAVLMADALKITPGNYAITVGAGGAGNAADNQTNNGGSSSAFGVTATGGGAGGNEDGNEAGSGANGGGGPYGSRAGGTGTAPTANFNWTVYAGNNGGAGQPGSAEPYGCGGGGGAALVGRTADNQFGRGDGGSGVSSNILGEWYHFGGGGGGVTYQGANSGGKAGHGGNGGGGGGSGVSPGYAGRGAPGFQTGQSGLMGGNSDSALVGGAGGANTGGGGGGGANENVPGGNGGSGVVIVRYRKNPTQGGSTDKVVKSPLPNISNESNDPRRTYIRDGLVLDLDASNQNSYSGDGYIWRDLAGSFGDVNVRNRSNDWSFRADPTTKLMCVYNISNRTDGNSPGINVPMANFPKMEGTIEIWLKPMGDHTGGHGWFNNSDGSAYTNNGSWHWIGTWSTSNVLYFRQGNPATCCNDVTVQSFRENWYPLGEWHHWTVTWSVLERSGKIYRDGVLLSERRPYNAPYYTNSNSPLPTDIPNSNPTGTGQLFNGHERSDNMQFKGYCNQYRIYNRELGPEEITRNYNATRTRFGL